MKADIRSKKNVIQVECATVKINEIYMVHIAVPYNWSSTVFIRKEVLAFFYKNGEKRKRITCAANKVELR